MPALYRYLLVNWFTWCKARSIEVSLQTSSNTYDLREVSASTSADCMERISRQMSERIIGGTAGAAGFYFERNRRGGIETPRVVSKSIDPTILQRTAVPIERSVHAGEAKLCYVPNDDRLCSK